MEAESGQRVVLLRKDNSMVKYRWTGAEPEGLYDVELAEELGAQWEDDELVTYDLPGLVDVLTLHGETYLHDND